MSRSRLHNDIGRYYNSEKETEMTERMKRYFGRCYEERDYVKPLQNKKKEKQANKDMHTDVDEYLFEVGSTGGHTVRKERELAQMPS